MDEMKAVLYGASLTVAGYGVGFGVARGGGWAAVSVLCTLVLVLLYQEAPPLFVREPSQGE